MPLVFVHGVGAREGTTTKERDKFTSRVKARDELFREIGLAGLVQPPASLHIENPYWGGYAAKFTHDLGSVPGVGTELFGSTAEDEMFEIITETMSTTSAAQLANETDVETTLLIRLARQNPKLMLPLVVDALIAAAASQPTTDASQVDADLVGFAAAVMGYLNPPPDKPQPRFDWLSARHPVTGRALSTDDEFLEALSREVHTYLRPAVARETYGGSKLLERLKGAASALGIAAKRAVAVVAGVGAGAAMGAVATGAPGGGRVLRRIRPVATQRAGIFVGDVFAYLNSRGEKDSPSDIVRVVRDALANAASRRTEPDSKLVVVAHSMGGDIVYDILTHFDPAIHVDAFVTVGSQVALFKELKLYVEDKGSSPVVSGLISKPTNIGLWVNVFDPLDVLGFATEGVFAGVKDFAFATQASPLDAHSTYFIRPNFHERLRARLAEVGLGVAA
jgi:hypothetical protein